MFDYKCIAYLNMEERTMWENKLENSTDLLKYSSEHFKKLLQFYQNTIKNLIIEGKVSETDIDFGIHSLKNLEGLKVFSDINIRQFISKIRHPLKNLIVEGKKNSEFLATCEQIYQVQDTVYLPDTKLTYQQFIRFKAKQVKVNIGYLTETDIYNFVKLWKKGDVGKNYERYVWCLNEDTNFDFGKLSELGKFEGRYISIEHSTDSEETAILGYTEENGRIAKIGMFPLRIANVMRVVTVL